MPACGSGAVTAGLDTVDPSAEQIGERRIASEDAVVIPGWSVCRRGWPSNLLANSPLKSGLADSLLR